MSVTPDEFRAAVAAAATNTATAQATIAEQGARIERVLTAVEAIISTQSTTGAHPASSHAPSASSASSSAGTMPDGTPTEQSHGLHTPARADTFDMLHREQNLLSKITDRRLEPFNLSASIYIWLRVPRRERPRRRNDRLRLCQRH